MFYESKLLDKEYKVFVGLASGKSIPALENSFFFVTTTIV